MGTFLPSTWLRATRACGDAMRAIAAVLGLIVAANAHAGESDRLFRNGFEPCCSLGGEVAGLSGGGLILHLQTDSVAEDLPIAAHAGLPRLYIFAASLPGGTGYIVSISSQPGGQSCTLSNASGTVEDADIDDIDVNCVATPGLIWDQGNWDAADWQ